MNRIVSDKYPQMLVGRLSKYDVKNQNTKVDQMGAVSVNAYESRTIRDKRYAIVLNISTLLLQFFIKIVQKAMCQDIN